MNDTENFKSHILSFSKNIELIRDFINMVEPLLTKEGKKQAKKDAKHLLPLAYLSDNAGKLSAKDKKAMTQITGIKSVKQIGDNGLAITVSDLSKFKGIEQALKRAEFSFDRSNFLYETSLISLISATEWFFCQTLKLHFSRYPDIITEKSGLSFTFKDLKNFKTITDAQNYLLEQKIDSIIRGSFINWIEYLNTTLKINTKNFSAYLDDTYEFFLRRNLMVHNRGIVNNTYKNFLPKKLNSNDQINIGDKLKVNKEYLIQKSYLIEIIFLDIASQFWFKQIKTETEMNEFTTIYNNNIIYEHLKEERYEVASHLSKIMMNNMKLPEKDRVCAQINYWIAEKYMGNYETIKDSIISSDFSAKDNIFLLAKLAITEDNKKFFNLLPYVAEPKGRLTEKDLQEWPLFNLQRKNKRKFGEALKAIRELKEEAA
ncbi:MAG: hypothetical protein GW903_04780 [Alphaproteobacteria bacterium]|nr:hypothetical protein [Alphaproteobacteria bacterium]NCQ88285.1 hypothetical protein [Alphaproteobacteria bacterium]NCT05208.1 hypothetical protein [Alphaproteobacteria bacterium]